MAKKKSKRLKSYAFMVDDYQRTVIMRALKEYADHCAETDHSSPKYKADNAQAIEATGMRQSLKEMDEHTRICIWDMRVQGDLDHD